MPEPVTGFAMRGIRKTFGGTVAVDAVDFRVSPGEVCALVGQNGAGKSTLMSVLSGALQPDAGSMTLEGAPYRPRSPQDARQAGVAMIYQELSLAPHLSVAENMQLGMEPTRAGVIRWAEMRATARRVLAQLGHPDIDPDAPVASLSVAEQQLVEVGRALAVGSRVLVLDEPTSSLGRDDVRRLFDLIRQLRAQRHAIVYISHFIEEVKEIADRIVVLRDGRVAGEGAAADLAPNDVVRLMVGGRVDDLFPRTARTRGPVALEVEAFGTESASFALHRGEILGIAGLLGAGRTRLLRGIFGLDAVRTGRVRVGMYSGPASPHARWRHGVGMVSEDRKGEGLAMGLAVADNLTLSHLTRLGPRGLVLPSRQEAAARTWIDRLGIRTGGPRQRMGELSGGNQQKVAIARLLHHDVDVLLLDEPTRGIDVASKAQIYALIDSLVAASEVAASKAAASNPRSAASEDAAYTADVGRNFSSGACEPKAVLLVSSYFPELLGLCDRIAVMCRGRLGPARPAAEWDEHALVLAATGAGDAA